MEAKQTETSSLAGSSESVRLYTEPAGVSRGAGIQDNGLALGLGAGPAASATTEPLLQRPAPASPEHSARRSYKWRWVVLTVFFLNLGMNNMVWITLAPVADVIRCYYDISTTWVNTTTTVGMATYVLFFLPCVWFLDRYGLRATLVMASITNALGTAVRVAGTGTYRTSSN